MINQLYDRFLNGTLIPYPLSAVGESPAVFGVSVALLGVTLVILRRRNAHYVNNNEELSAESLFPTPAYALHSKVNEVDPMDKSDAEKLDESSAASFFAPLRLVCPEYNAAPHAFLRKILATEGIALQELVSRANSLQLLVDTSGTHQSPVCVELLHLAQQILKCASQRHATAELLLDDAEEQSIDAARELLESPLQLETSFDSGILFQIDSKSNWADTTRSLLLDVEQDLRIAAVG